MDSGGVNARVCERVRDRVSFVAANPTRDEPPDCDVAIVGDIWRRPSAATRREHEEFPTATYLF